MAIHLRITSIKLHNRCATGLCKITGAVTPRVVQFRPWGPGHLPIDVDETDSVTRVPFVVCSTGHKGIELERERPVSDDVVFEWGAPPDAPKRSGSGRSVMKRWLDTATQLKENPDEWALVEKHDNKGRASNHATRIRVGKSRAFNPAGHFSAVPRPLVEGEDEGEWGVWAAYTGEPAEPVDTDGEAAALEDDAELDG